MTTRHSEKESRSAKPTGRRPQLVKKNLRWTSHVARSPCTFLNHLAGACSAPPAEERVLLSAAPPCSVAKFAPIDNQPLVLTLSNLQRVPSLAPNVRYVALHCPVLCAYLPLLPSA